MTCSLDGVKPVVVPPGGFTGEEKEAKGPKKIQRSCDFNVFFGCFFFLVFPPWDLDEGKVLIAV